MMCSTNNSEKRCQLQNDAKNKYSANVQGEYKQLARNTHTLRRKLASRC